MQHLEYFTNTSIAITLGTAKFLDVSTKGSNTRNEPLKDQIIKRIHKTPVNLDEIFLPGK